MLLKVDIWHNILWSRYKGGVFSELYRIAGEERIDIRFFQIAETEKERRPLSGVEFSFHKYPFTLISKGAYEEIPLFYLLYRLFFYTFDSTSDVVVLAGYHRVEYWIQLLAALLTGKEVMVFCDSTYYDRRRNFIKDFLKKVFFRLCAGFFCYGKRSEEYLMTYGVPAKKINTRCQAAALPDDYDRLVSLEKRIAFLHTSPPPVVLYVGRLAPEKNLDLLLLAFRNLSQTVPNCTMRLVGGGPELNKLQETVAQFGLSSRVRFVGSLSGRNLWAEYEKATCLVLPSLSEPWGLVVNEAMSFGCPVVVSDRCGCVPELVHQGKTGFQFDASNVNDLEAKLRQVLSTDFDIKGAAQASIELIGSYSASNAAFQILNGIKKLSNLDGVTGRRGASALRRPVTSYKFGAVDLMPDN